MKLTITRDIEKINTNKYLLHDYSEGWRTAILNAEQHESLLNNALDLNTLKWE